MADAKDAEFAYLGAAMTDAEVLESTSLTADDFNDPTAMRIFAALLDRHGRRLGVSQALMSDALPNDAVVIWSATDNYADVVNWPSMEQAIRDRSTRRKLTDAASRIVQAAGSQSEVDHVIEFARAEMDRATANDERKAVSMLVDAADVLAELRKAVKVYPSPWKTLNDTITGFAPGRMTVVGARPGVGKSAVASQIAYELASHGPVVFATMEMDKGEVYSRIVSQQAGIYYGGMTGQLPDFLAAREEAWLREQVRDIRVLDSGTQTVQSIRAAVRATAREQPVAGVVVDYIHLLTTPQRIENETQRINEITRSLKQMAMDLHVPVIALSQLNRGGDTGMPSLRDLRGSGGIEQDADAVIFLYRDEDTADHQLMVHVAKNRQGPNFVSFPLNWEGEFVRAVDP